MRPKRPGSVTGSVILIVLTAVLAGAALAAASTVTKGSSPDRPRWLGSRTTDDGVTLRLSAYGSRASSMGIDETQIPADCFADTNLVVGVSTDRVAQETMASFRADADSLQASATVIPGAVHVVTAQAPRGAARAVARFSDGTRDEADAMGRYFVFARKGPASAANSWGRTPRTRTVDVVVYDANDDVIGRTTVSNEYAVAPLDLSRPECRPQGSSLIMVPATQPLPEPTGPPPADEDAARAAITAAFAGAYPAEGNVDAALANVEGGDTPAVRAAREQASAANPQYVGRVTAVVAEIRFLDDQEAAVRFEFRLDGQPFYSPQVGFAVLTSDGWKMSRSTYCDQLQTAGNGITC